MNVIKGIVQRYTVLQKIVLSLSVIMFSSSAFAGPLSNGVAVSGVSGGSNLYSIAVPAGERALTISIYGATSGDPDLYVRRNAVPTTSRSDFKSTTPSQVRETIIITAQSTPALIPGSTYNILVSPYAAYTNLTVLAEIGLNQATPAVALSSGVPITGISAGYDPAAQKQYFITVPPGSRALKVTLSGMTSGDPDLFISRNTVPTRFVNDFMSRNTGLTAESITINATSTPALVVGSVYKILVKTYRPYSGMTITAVVTGPPGNNLTILKTGAGAGTVTSSPAGINCGTNCVKAFKPGTVVTLTAAAAAGSRFTGWTGTGCGATVTMSTALTCTATFAIKPAGFTLTIIKNGTGTGTVTSTPGGINCGPTCSNSFAKGSNVRIGISVAAGSYISGAVGPGCIPAAPGQPPIVSMTQNRSCTYTFTRGTRPTCSGLTFVSATGGYNARTGQIGGAASLKKDPLCTPDSMNLLVIVKKRRILYACGKSTDFPQGRGVNGRVTFLGTGLNTSNIALNASGLITVGGAVTVPALGREIRSQCRLTDSWTGGTKVTTVVRESAESVCSTSVTATAVKGALTARKAYTSGAC